MPHVGRIPSTLEKYRHALSAYLEDINQLNFKSSGFSNADRMYATPTLSKSYISNLSDDSLNYSNHSNSIASKHEIPDTETRINHSYQIVKKQLELLSSYFTLIHDDLHGDLLLLRTNLSLLPSATPINEHKSNRNNHNKTITNAIASNHLDSIIPSDPEDDDNNESDTMNDNESQCGSSNHGSSDDSESSMNSENILNTKQTRNIQYIVSMLQKFIKYNSILVDHIHKNKDKIRQFWIQDQELKNQNSHKLNLDVESIVSTMCVKDFIHTKNFSCHNILYHDILGCANTKQFFTRIYFIVSIWYSFFHHLHLKEYHDDDDSDCGDDDDQKKDVLLPCGSYLTKLFAMTEFSFLTKTSNNNNNNNNMSSSSNTTQSSTNTGSVSSRRRLTLNNDSNHSTATLAGITTNDHTQTSNPTQRQLQLANNDSNYSLSRQSSNTDSYEWSNDSNDSNEETELSYWNDDSQNDFLLKYLNAQNNYLQSIWNDAISLLEYSLHLLQQQEFRLSCRVAHRCLELFQKEQMEQDRSNRTNGYDLQTQRENWNQLNRDLHRPPSLRNQRSHTPDPRARAAQRRRNAQMNANANNAGQVMGPGPAGLFLIDANQPASIPGLWYIEMHLANCYHTWGQSNMALYHINRTLEQLGNYQINADTLIVRLNTVRKFKKLSCYLVGSTKKRLSERYKQEIENSKMKTKKHNNYINAMRRSKSDGSIGQENRDMHFNDDNDEDEDDDDSKFNIHKKKTFMKRIKINHRNKKSKKSKNNMFSKLLDHFNHSKKKIRRKQKEIYNMDGVTEYEEWNITDKSDNDAQNVDNNAELADQVDFYNAYDAMNLNSPENLANNTDDDDLEDDDDDDDMFNDDNLNDDNDDDDDYNDDGLVIVAMDDSKDNIVEYEYYENDSGNEDNDNVQMITLEALLSMHMTKGRILIEMKLLSEALGLYTYIIDECESLIAYHEMVNPHHVELEREFDQINEEKFDPSSPHRRNRRRRSRRDHVAFVDTRNNNNNNINGNNGMNNNVNNIVVGGNAGHVGINNHHNHHHQHRHNANPPPNTPFRRLTKGIGLENYYAARGDIYFKFKDLSSALADFSNAIKYGKCKKEMGIYYNLRGVCYHEMKQYERALKDYDNAVKSMYGNHVAWNNRAALLVDMRDYDEAIANANNAIKLDPSYGNAYKHRGVAYHLKCEYEKAITDINRCIKLLPNYRPARLALLAIWKDIFECVRIIHVDEAVPLDLCKIVVDYTVGNGYEIDEYMVNFTYC